MSPALDARGRRSPICTPMVQSAFCTKRKWPQFLSVHNENKRTMMMNGSKHFLQVIFLTSTYPLLFTLQSRNRKNIETRLVELISTSLFRAVILLTKRRQRLGTNVKNEVQQLTTGLHLHQHNLLNKSRYCLQVTSVTYGISRVTPVGSNRWWYQKQGDERKR